MDAILILLIIIAILLLIIASAYIWHLYKQYKISKNIREGIKRLFE